MTNRIDHGRNGRNGTVRFAPYYKLEWYDTRALAWRPIQRSLPTQAEAEDEADALCREKQTEVRIYCIDGPGAAGRSVVATWSPTPTPIFDNG